MAGTVGVEATKRFCAALQVVAPAIILRAKDGVGADDVIALAANQEFRAAVAELVSSAKALPAEGKDLQVEELVELTPHTVALIVAIIGAVRKPAA